MSEAPASAEPTTKPASPLSIPVFRAIWIATVASNIGTWMHDVGAGWLMTSLSPDPLMVALIQAATTLPMFLFALPAGALADMVDKRRILIAAQSWGLLAAATLAALTFAGSTTPLLLLLLTFAIATGAAFNSPTFQSVVPELVPSDVLPGAVALNSLAVNIARSIGPAIGGLIIALAGPQAVFALNALSFSGVLLVIIRWRREPRASVLPPEHFIPALRSGFRYARNSLQLQTVLVRSLGFFLFASAGWAFLPIIARRELGLPPTGYGIMLASIGAGAVLGAVLLPRVRLMLGANRLTVLASMLFAFAILGLAGARNLITACLVLAISGTAWISVISSFNVAAQLSVPAWVKARGLALYLVTFQGAMAAGSAVWGLLANYVGIRLAMTIAAAGLLFSLLLAARWRIASGAVPDLAPSMHWPEPVVAGDPEPDRGPVLITVEYQIDPARASEFGRAMIPLGRIRRRDGALSWGIYEDAARPGFMLEAFVVQSWLEHLRQHERVTNADRVEQETVRQFHVGSEAPVVRHLIAPA